MGKKMSAFRQVNCEVGSQHLLVIISSLLWILFNEIESFQFLQQQNDQLKFLDYYTEAAAWISKGKFLVAIFYAISLFMEWVDHFANSVVLSQPTREVQYPSSLTPFCV